MKILSFTTALICLQLISYAQSSITLTGEVRDSLGIPLEYANVIAIDTTTKEMAGFAVTNFNGQFKLRLKSDIHYSLKITFIGYVPLELVAQFSESNDDPYLFTLNSDVTQLSGVEITAEMPVTIRGDTIIYEVEAFNQGNERKLEDVLEDLPGFEVGEEGDIKVQGRNIDKVLIDGKEFFNGDSKMATKNIPANVVDKVQLLQNYNNISPLSNVNNSEQLALNIKLKEDSKQIVFGDVAVGGGPSERYYGHGNAFYYDDKTNINLIADANNIGELAFSMRDYFRFAGGLGSLAQRNGSNLSISSDQLGIPMAEKNSAASLDNQLLAYNMTLRPSKTWQFTGFAIGSLVDNSFASNSSRQYLQGNSSLNELFQSQSRLESQSALGQFEIKYTPSPNLQLDYKYFGRRAAIENNETELSIVSEQQNDILGLHEQNPWSSEHQISGFYAVGDNDVLSMETTYKNQFQDPFYNLITSRQPFEGTLPLLGTDNFNLNQSRNIETRNIESVINYYHIINRRNHIRINAGYSSTEQVYSATLLESNEQNEELEDPLFNNNVNYEFTDKFVGILFKNKWEKLTWTPQLDVHYYSIQHRQFSDNISFNRLLLLPKFRAKYEIRTSQNVQFDYAMTAQFMDVQRIASNQVLNNYNLLDQGNPELRNSVYHRFNLNYSNFNMYTFLNIYGGISYQRKVNDIQNSFEQNQWERISLPTNSQLLNEQANAYLNIEKRFDSFRVGLDSRWVYSLMNNVLNDFSNENINYQQQYKAFGSARLLKKLSIKASYGLTLNDYRGNQTESTFINEEVAIKTDLEIGKEITWSTTASLNSYRSTDRSTSSNYNLIDSSIRYRKDGSAWEFSVNGLNLLNTERIRRDSFNDNLISTYSFAIQPRYGMLTVMLDF